jgi:hypothetical protein
MNNDPFKGLNQSIEEAGKRIMANPDHPATKELVEFLRKLQEALEPIGSDKTKPHGTPTPYG